MSLPQIAEPEGMQETVRSDASAPTAPDAPEKTAADAAAEAKAVQEQKDIINFKKVLRAQAHEGDTTAPGKLTLRKVLGGDILTTNYFKNQIGVFLVITGFMIVYIANRYGVQQALIKIDRLRTELQDVKYRALSSSSELTEKSRESNVLEQLKTNQDSVLKQASQPPYIIVVPDE